MCVNYTPSRNQALKDAFDIAVFDDTQKWPEEAWQDYQAPIIRSGQSGQRELAVANYGMVPKRHLPPKARFTTMNARSETVGQLTSYSKAWKAGQLCLVPMQAFFEPNWEGGTHVRWRIGMADDSDFAVAGIWRTWNEPDGTISTAFTQLTINADEHALMRRFHKPEDEKRSLVIVPPTEYDAWLSCRDPEVARSFLQLYPAEKMAARPAPRPPAAKKSKITTIQPDLDAG